MIPNLPLASPAPVASALPVAPAPAAVLVACGPALPDGEAATNADQPAGALAPAVVAVGDVLPPPPDWMTKEDEQKQCLVFLITFAAILALTAARVGAAPKALVGVTRAQVRDSVLDAVANPAVGGARGGRPRSVPLTVLKLVVFEEEPKHFHVALKLSHLTRFLPLKTALRIRSGFATHWSTSHTMFWSALRYGSVATEQKREVDRSPLVWPEGGVHIYKESQEPFIAGLVKKRREAKEMHPDFSRPVKETALPN